jgi:hypothetical protein
MADQNSLITRPRDYSNIIHLQDPTVLEDFLKEPLTFIAETITGVLAVGKIGTMVAGGRIVQALLKGQSFKQWGREFRALRDGGKIPSDFADGKYGFQTWVELMTIIDEDSPDTDRQEALKAIFYAVNKIGLEDKDRVVAYQLWQITKQLNSGDLLLLKTLNERGHLGGTIYDQWLAALTGFSGLGFQELVELHVKRLLEFRLLEEDRGAATRRPARLSMVGHRLCMNIATFRIDLDSATSQGS